MYMTLYLGAHVYMHIFMTIWFQKTLNDNHITIRINKVEYDMCILIHNIMYIYIY